MKDGGGVFFKKSQKGRKNINESWEGRMGEGNLDVFCNCSKGGKGGERDARRDEVYKIVRFRIFDTFDDKSTFGAIIHFTELNRMMSGQRISR